MRPLYFRRGCVGIHSDVVGVLCWARDDETGSVTTGRERDKLGGRENSYMQVETDESMRTLGDNIDDTVEWMNSTRD